MALTVRRLGSVPGCVLASACLLPGCVAVMLPRGASAEERALLGSTPQFPACDVIAGRPSIRDRASDFAGSLSRTGLFGRVRFVEGEPDPSAWCVQVDSIFGGVPCWMVCPDGGTVLMELTLGVIPKVGGAPSRFDFVVTAPAGAEAGVRSLQLRDEPAGVCGWIALPALLLPWWFTTPDSERQCGPVAERVSAEIARMAREGVRR